MVDLEELLHVVVTEEEEETAEVVIEEEETVEVVIEEEEIIDLDLVVMLLQKILNTVKLEDCLSINFMMI